MNNNEINNPFELIVVLIVGSIIASAVFGTVMPRFGAWLLSHLIGWGVLVPNPVISVPGTAVGLDAARLVIFVGVLVAVIGLAGRRRRGEEHK